ncbi:HlyD family efflux transporter periplasmic adaptor subunit [Dysosmobacter sp.]|uniref:HlyD family efflux transporter periplasmic adaptor subunit n=1 Tax=Dysosmobacter sp. TaxID=2591382 RepID=UPI002A8651C5|nr:HlyD family efflux transporter periplasmic adaptor subunit [Dysosmobacter sp.]MDY3280785.1 HlyD family efflux transporter periplasmic adaptor subunit [Dysosmobacter sp.]
MKSLGTKLLMAAVCLTVLAYFGLQGYRYLDAPYTTVLAYAYQQEESAAVSGWVIREEQVLPDDTTGLLRLTRSEGEKVAKGGKLAVVYADEASLQRQSDLDALQTRIDQLHYARDAALSSEAGLKLDTQILRQILDFRGDVAADQLSDAEDHMSQLRSLVLKRDYTYTDSGDLDAALQQLESQLSALKSQSAATTRAVTAPVSGVWSAVTDGYEGVLTPAVLDTLTPDTINRFEADGETSQLGRLITGDTWYYAASMDAAAAQRLTVGKTVTLRFVKGSGRDLQVKVRSVSEEQGGRVVAVFSSRQYLSELTLLRRQSADVITDSISGIRVPSNALRVMEDGAAGVYCVVGMNARFKPVEVLYTDESGYALVKPLETESGKTVLRAGDEVLVTARELYDGMIVE